MPRADNKQGDRCRIASAPRALCPVGSAGTCTPQRLVPSCWVPGRVCLPTNPQPARLAWFSMAFWKISSDSPVSIMFSTWSSVAFFPVT